MSDAVVITPNRLCLRDITPGNFQPEIFASGPDHGLGFYEPGLVTRYSSHMASYVTAASHEDREPWLPVETAACLSQIDSGNSLILEGDYGAGKSTVLFGARYERRLHRQGYALIDGHRDRTTAGRIGKVLDWATRHELPVFWDSFDYLVNKKRRKVVERTPQIFDDLHGFFDQGGQLVATTHTEPWIDLRAKDELIADWKDLTEKIPHLRVWGLWDNPGLVSRFCQISGCTKEAANRYANLCQNNLGFLDWLASTGLDESKMTEIRDSLRQYRVVKQLLALGARDWRHGFNELSSSSTDVFENLVKDILFINSQTRAKMGVSEDYRLTPA